MQSLTSRNPIGENKPRAIRGHRVDEESAVEVFVALFAAGFSYEQTAVAGGTMQVAVIVATGWIVIGTDGIV